MAAVRPTAGRRSGSRVALVCACVVGALAAGGCGSGGSVRGSDSASVASSASLLNDALPIADGQWPADGRELEGQRELERANPVAAAERRWSSTRFEHLDSADAIRVIRATQPGVVAAGRSGVAALRAGERVTRYLSPNVARVSLPGGKHALIESLAPIAAHASAAGYAPLDLTLRQEGESFVPERPAAPVHIARDLQEGASLPSIGVSLTPVGQSGAPLEAEGTLQGGAVLYANSEQDADTAVKATPSGFETDVVLRSVESPQELDFEVGLPAGAALLPGSEEGTFARVVSATGAVLASIPSPTAVDAAGTPVPVSMEASGQTLHLHVTHGSGDYEYPIVVDPEVWDEQLDKVGARPTNWHFEHQWTSFTASENAGGKGWTEHIASNHTNAEWGAFVYTTRGESWISDFTIQGDWDDEGSHIENSIKIIGPPPYPGAPAVEEANEFLPANEGAPDNFWSICTGCWYEEPRKTPEHGNSAEYLQESGAAGGGIGGENTLDRALVEIQQEKGAEVKADTSDALLSNRANVLYSGKSGWLGPNSGAFELQAHDSGVGVSYLGVSGGGWSQTFPLFEKGECSGVQCATNLDPILTYNSKMTNGEDSLEVLACDEMEEPAQCASIWPLKLKVDGVAPHELELTGLPESGAVDYEKSFKLSAKAVDGSGTTPSAGIESLRLAIDGKEVDGSAGSCTPGPCSVSGAWTIQPEAYEVGEHRATLTATDNAGNVASTTASFTVVQHQAAPVQVGPGQVNPVTGDFEVEETDVSVPTAGVPLVVAQGYDSRDPEAGVDGPLGAPWSMSLGGSQMLERLAGGNMVLTNASGAQTTFINEGGGRYQSPPGDRVLQLTEVAGGAEFRLVDKDSSTVFKHTPGDGKDVWHPTTTTESSGASAMAYSYEAASKDTIEYGVPAEGRPQDVTEGPEGNLWFTELSASKIAKMTPSGTLTEYALPPVSEPGTITLGPDGNLWFTEYNKIGKITPAGVITQYAVPSGSYPSGITTGPDGDLWFTNYNKIGKITTSGAVTEYSLPASGAVQEITAGPGGDLWFTEFSGESIGKITPSGVITEYKLSYTGPDSITVGPDGNLWFTELVENKIAKMTPSGAVTEYSVPSAARLRVIRPGPDGELWFSEETNKIGTITTSGAVTEYTLPSGSEPGRITAGPNGYLWYTNGKSKVGKMTTAGPGPAEALAPVPGGVSCSTELAEPTELERGCRALNFYYSSSTTATGVAKGEWGAYMGHLSEVTLTAWNSTLKVMLPVAVARYEYDARGRLRAEWDPRVAPALKTIYGYDSEGHLTSITPPAEQPWVFSYGEGASDSNPGRLLKVTRAQPRKGASEAEVGKTLEEQLILPEDTEAPAITGSAAVGVRLAASQGHWSHSPVVYGYQWEDCNASGGACTPITGAIDPNYTPVAGDVGHKLVVRVTATNSGGSVVAVSAPSVLVATSPSGSSETQSIDSGASLNAVSCIPASTDCIVSDSKGAALYATNVSATGAASWKAWGGPGKSPSEAVSCPSSSLCLMAAGADSGNGGSLFYATSLGGSWTEAYEPAWGVDAISCASSSFCVDGQNGYGYFRWATSPASAAWHLQSQGSTSAVAMKGVFCLSSSFCALADAVGSVHVATTESQVESSSWTETSVDAPTVLNGIACTSRSACVAVDGKGDVLDLAIGGSGAATASKQDIDGTNSLTAVSCGGSTCEAVDNVGNVFMSANAGKTWTKTLSLGYALTSVSCASATLCVATDAQGRVTAVNPSGAEGEARAPELGSTIEYGVPLSGAGLPTMIAAEVKKWGQIDEPTEAMAVFPQGREVGWPAGEYKHATIYYLDGLHRNVNVAAPGGGIATSEYNEYNDVVRSLSPDNRAAALAEGAKSVEVSQELDTQSAYGDEGAELLSTLGPLHTVKLASGTQVQARKHTVYSYDEGAPAEGGPYRLLTKKTEGAQIAGEPEADVSTTVESYSGEKDLGWTLRKPTSVTVDPAGLDLTHTTVYNPNTGEVVEARGPGHGGSEEEEWEEEAEAEEAEGSGEGSGVFGFQSAIGSEGAGNGQFRLPVGVAVAPNGDLWVADKSNKRLEEFNAKGEYLRKIGGGSGELDEVNGVAVAPNGDVWAIVQESSVIEEFSESGTYLRQIAASGSGYELARPEGIAVDQHGNVWVSNTYRAQVDEFNESGVFVKAIGTDELGEPEGVEVDAAGDVWVADWANESVYEFAATGKLLQQFGSYGAGAGEFNHPLGLALDANGDVWVADEGNSRVEEFEANGKYVTQFGSEGTGAEQFSFSYPSGIAIDSSGAIWVPSPGGDRIEKWAEEGSSSHEGGGKGGSEGEDKGSSKGPHASRIVYYTTGSNSRFPACGEHPEWAQLPCQTVSAEQPETPGLPSLPVTTVTYNVWDEPTITTTTVGSATRTSTVAYDGAGRVVSESTTSTTGRAIPTVKDKYSETSGELIEQRTEGEAGLQTITSSYDTLGRQTSYKDADGAKTEYEYEDGGEDRLLHVYGEKGTQAYAYEEATGALKEVLDSEGTNAFAFTGSYDVEGNLTAQRYPDGLEAEYTINSVGETTAVHYVKQGCAKECTWYADSVAPSIHGQWVTQESSLSAESYGYDGIGRLSEVRETPTGEGCTTRLYGYDTEGDRTSVTTRAPASGGACASSGGTTQSHSFDAADRLADAGVSYNSFGDITALPASDAGGTALTSSFYVDGQLSGQTQGGQTIEYDLDPEGRVRETVDTGTSASTLISHYAGPGDAPAWTSEPSSGHWISYMSGLAGVGAVVSSTAEPVLQLTDLKGDIVATASAGEAATKLLSVERDTEFGVPTSAKPAKYGWLGSAMRATELSSGVVAMGVRSYVSTLGQFLQPDPVAGGSATPYGYADDDPVNATDLTGDYVENNYVAQFNDEENIRAQEREAAREELAKLEAELKAGIEAGGEDPTDYLSQKEALELGERLKSLKSWGEIWDAVDTVLGIVDPVDLLEGAVIGAISLDVMQDWLHNVAGKLEQCGKNTEGWVVGCELKYSTLLGGKFIDPYSMAEVEKCGTYVWYKKFVAKEAWECRRLGQGPVPVG
ncbi:MAG TPA: RHS repeat-associated core domain-containing protein [Solirubrobacteraceae bacterium]|jgi:RHS repeat-associated protein